VNVDLAGAEGDRRSGEVADPRPVRTLAYQPPSLVGSRLQACEPFGGRAGVVSTQTLDVEDLEACVLHSRSDVAHALELGPREDVAREKGHSGRVSTRRRMGDAMVQQEPTRPEQPMQALEVRWIVRDTDVLDDADRRDLVERGLAGDVAIVTMLDPSSIGESGVP
jgi:hypothetical protein